MLITNPVLRMAKLEALEARLCMPSKGSVPSWLGDSDLRQREKRLAHSQAVSDRQRIEGACILALQGKRLKECASAYRLQDKKTIKVAFHYKPKQ